MEIGEEQEVKGKIFIVIQGIANKEGTICEQCDAFNKGVCHLLKCIDFENPLLVFKEKL